VALAHQARLQTASHQLWLLASKPLQLRVLSLGLLQAGLLLYLLLLLVVVGEVNAAIPAELAGVAVVVG
jgi:hypothetical protein